MESRKILLTVFGLNLLILAKVAIVNGDAAETTTAILVSVDDETLVTEGTFENEPYTTTGQDCVCNCKNHDHLVDCVTEAGQESQTENIQLGMNANSITDSALGTGIDNIPDTTNRNEESVITTGVTKLTGDTNSVTTEHDSNIPDVELDATSGAPKNPEQSTINSPPLPPCSNPGLQPHDTDCHAFYDCSSAESLDGSLRLLTKFCASNQAFSIEFNSCSRDISPCSNVVVCLSKGGVADPSSNNSYYLCEPRLIGGGFHVFHVQCGESEIFYPELGKCFLDFNNLAQQPYPAFPPYNWNQFQDIDIVKAELKVIKEHDKVKLRFEKEKIKAENKLQKDAAKQAERIAKEQEKLTKDLIKQESDNFICLQQGNFTSNISQTVYYACAAKKNKYKKTLMKCPLRSVFNAESGACVTDGSAPNNPTETDDEGEGDDD